MKNINLVSCHVAMTLSLTTLVACQRGEEKTQYQFCANVERAKGSIKDILVQLAMRNDMQFSDRSAEAERESRALDRKNRKIGQSYPFVMMNIWNSSGFSLTVTNAGLPANQLLLGITTDGQRDSRELTAGALRKFSSQWKLVMVPPGKGALPLICGGVNYGDYGRLR